MPKEKPSAADAGSEAAEQYLTRCRFDRGNGRCPARGWKVADWGDGKRSWFCEEHWDDREAQRPAPTELQRRSIATLRKIAACGHPEKTCPANRVPRCQHALEHFEKTQPGFTVRWLDAPMRADR